ncbi:hypothetical protein C5167_006055 [Papaver somniferum]|uniref:Uncharacterized protein n=1 Tax=Papaver somniferum TaxID=3469 RepID=A0A4Y7JFD1_PAPSO|nr:hypothetical protein C5167_006055 [Papaver somniferum]
MGYENYFDICVLQNLTNDFDYTNNDYFFTVSGCVLPDLSAPLKCRHYVQRRGELTLSIVAVDYQGGYSSNLQNLTTITFTYYGSSYG